MAVEASIAIDSPSPFDLEKQPRSVESEQSRAGEGRGPKCGVVERSRLLPSLWVSCRRVKQIRDRYNRVLV